VWVRKGGKVQEGKKKKGGKNERSGGGPLAFNSPDRLEKVGEREGRTPRRCLSPPRQKTSKGREGIVRKGKREGKRGGARVKILSVTKLSAFFDEWYFRMTAKQ